MPNIFLAEKTGGDIVTVLHDISGTAARMYGMDLTTLSLDTVRMFAKNVADAGFQEIPNSSEFIYGAMRHSVATRPR